MAPHIAQMIAHIASDLGLQAGQVNIKAKTNEKLGYLGREEGMAARDAILETCRERARPVVLTAVTAVLGVLAVAFGINIDFVHRDIAMGAPSTQWWINLSTAIVFGLGFATILTLIVTPAMLMGIANVSEWRAARRARRAERKALRQTRKAARGGSGAEPMPMPAE
jgi:multidrug efflux pump